jgi:hypothetical protein
VEYETNKEDEKVEEKEEKEKMTTKAYPCQNLLQDAPFSVLFVDALVD